MSDQNDTLHLASPADNMPTNRPAELVGENPRGGTGGDQEIA